MKLTGCWAKKAPGRTMTSEWDIIIWTRVLDPPPDTHTTPGNPCKPGLHVSHLNMICEWTPDFVLLCTVLLSPSTAETTENVHYWEQFRSTQDFSEDDWQNNRKKNLRLVRYCIVAMLLSIGAHYFGFR